MTVTLAPNRYPQGTLAGSPIKVIGDPYQQNGGQEFTAAIPIPAAAQAGDVIWAEMGFATQGSGSVGTLTTSPTGFFTSAGGNLAINGGSGPGVAQFSNFWRVLTGPEAGLTVGISWPSSLVQLGWGIVVYCLRFVNTSVVFDATGGGQTSGTTPSLNAATGQITTVTGGSLVIGELVAEGGAVNSGLEPGPLPGWRNSTGNIGGGQPNLAFVAGLMDMPAPGLYLGAGCQFTSGGVPGNTNWVGTLTAFRPTPVPNAPLFYLNPAGGSIDAMGTAGRQLTAHWVYTPVSGQGAQLSWLFARQPTAGGTAQFWNGDINGWVNNEYWNYGAISSYTFPASAWDVGVQYDTYMAITESALFLKSALAGPVTFTTQAPPAVTAVTVTNPGTTTPTINWTEALTASPQIAYRVRVFSSDQLALPGFDPHNILVDDDSDFELTIGTWSSTSATLTQGATHNLTGSGDLRMQATSTAGFFAFSGAYPVTPGVAYRALAYSWADATPRSMTLGIIWQDANGVTLSITNGTPATDSTTVWTQLTVAGTAPTGAVTARVTIKDTVSAVNEIHRLDQVHFAATPQPKWASGVVLSTATSATTAALAPSVQYTAYVEVLQTNDQWTPVSAVTDGAYVNNPTATWYAGLTTAPVPTPAALTATVGGV